VLAPEAEIALGILQVVAILLPLTGVFIRLAIGDAVGVSDQEREVQLGAAAAVAITLSAAGVSSAVVLDGTATSTLLEGGLSLLAVAFVFIGAFVLNLVVDQAFSDPEPAVTPLAPAEYRPGTRCWYQRYAAGDTQ
jgi:hypothetical protein